MTTTINTNGNTVSYYAEKIRDHLASATQSWRDIAELFATAAEEFGTGSESFKSLLKETNFSQSTADKLRRVARSERLATYRAKLALVDSWGTLYAIDALDDDVFNRLKEKHGFDDPDRKPAFLRRRDVLVDHVKPAPKSSLKPLATILIDEVALLCGDIDGEMYEEITEALETISGLSKYLVVRRTDLEEGFAQSQTRALDKCFKAEKNKAFRDLLKRVKKRIKVFPNETKKAAFVRVFGANEEEAQSAFEADPAEAFQRFGMEILDVNSLMQKARERLEKQNAERVKKLTQASEKVASSNNVTIGAGTIVPFVQSLN